MPNVTIYTDGSCLKNPGGNGGWAAVIKRDGEETRICGGVARTTNNRMEITALLEALRALEEPSVVTVVTDSQYVSNSVTKGWLAGWARKGWVDKEGNPRLNADLWKLLLEQLQRHRVNIQWIRGHAGHRENEICDKLARKAAAGPNLPLDEGYAAMLAQEAAEKASSYSKPVRRPFYAKSAPAWQARKETVSKAATPYGSAAKTPMPTSPTTPSPAAMSPTPQPEAKAETQTRTESTGTAKPAAPRAPRTRPAGAKLVPGSLEAMLQGNDNAK